VIQHENSILGIAVDSWWLPTLLPGGNEADSLTLCEGFIRTFLERDILQLGIQLPATAMRPFWTILAPYHAQTWNASGLSRAIGVWDKTEQDYLGGMPSWVIPRWALPRKDM